MNKYERNIQQIRDRGESAEMYFLDKTIEECEEVIEAINLYKYAIALGTNLSVEIEHLRGERSDLKNCLEYLDILFKDYMLTLKNMEYKLDRGYERGKNE